MVRLEDDRSIVLERADLLGEMTIDEGKTRSMLPDLGPELLPVLAEFSQQLRRIEG